MENGNELGFRLKWHNHQWKIYRKKCFTRDQTSSLDLNGLLPCLQWLDERLARAIATIQTEEDANTTAPYAGLIQPPPRALQRLLAREPGDSLFQEQDSIAVETISIREDSTLAWLQQVFELSIVELVIVTIALAPELDRRYEQVYAYLQDDVRCKRATVDLVLNLLCHSAVEKLTDRAYFATDALLVRQELLHFMTDNHSSRPIGLAQELYLDEQVVNLLLHQPGLDRQLQPFCRLIQPMKMTDYCPMRTLY